MPCSAYHGANFSSGATLGLVNGIYAAFPFPIPEHAYKQNKKRYAMVKETKVSLI